MPVIEIRTFVKAPLDSCFNLARRPDDIMQSIPRIKNTRVESKLVKRVGLGDKIFLDHLFIKNKLIFTTKYKVIEFVPPFKFSEEWTGLFFKEFRHVHEFVEKKEGTLIIDTIEYKMAFGPIGAFLNKKYVDEIIRTYVYNRIRLLKSRL